MADNDKRTDEEKTRGAQAEQRALVPDAEGNVRIDVIMGPYRGNLLTVPAAEGQAALDAHWARDPFTGVADYGTGHDPLSDEERATAHEAATTWARAQWETGAQEPPPVEPPPEGEGGTPVRRRAMAAENPGEYITRQAGGVPQQPAEPSPPPPPRRPR